jgi:hypothetical protein
MRITVYTLCALTSFAVAFLLLRGWARTRSPLLLWVGLCFSGFVLNNLLVIAEHLAVTNFEAWRSLPALAGIALLIYGVVWRSESQ